MSARTAERSRRSKIVFGNSHMLDMRFAIANLKDDEFTAPELTRALGVTATLVYTLLARLTEAEFITVAGTVPGERTVLYRRADPEAFRFALGLEARLEKDNAA
ncbi:hypothetical protein [Microbacterium lacticum]